MVFGSFSKESTTPLLISTKPVERVSEYKLLGVTVNAMLKHGTIIFLLSRLKLQNDFGF